MTKLKKAIKGTQATSVLPKEISMPSYPTGSNKGGVGGVGMTTSPGSSEAMTSAPDMTPAPVAQSAPVAKAPEKARPLLTHELYTQMTGKPWATAKKEGLTDGSAAANLKLKALLESKSKSTDYNKNIKAIESRDLKTSADTDKYVADTKNEELAELKRKLATPMVKKAPAKSAPVPVAKSTSAPRTIDNILDNISTRKPVKSVTVGKPVPKKTGKLSDNGFIAKQEKLDSKKTSRWDRLFMNTAEDERKVKKMKTSNYRDNLGGRRNIPFPE